MRFLLGDALALAVAAVFFAPFVLVIFLAVTVLLAPLMVYVCANPFFVAKDGSTRLESVQAVIGTLALALAITGPLRAITVGVWSNVPGALGYLSVYLAPAIDRYGPAVVAAIDHGWAITSAVALIGFALLDGAWRVLQARQIRILPTSRARSVALGLAELSGVARPTDPDHGDGEPILGIRNEDESRSSTLRPFWLEDESGRILVDPRGADLVDRGRHERTGLGGTMSGFGFRVCEVVLARDRGKTRKGRPEQVLRAGDPVYVVGTVRARAEHAADDVPARAEIVVAPRRRKRGFRFDDVFLMSDVDEATTERMIRHGMFRASTWAAIGIGLCVWLWSVAEIARIDPVAAYGYAPVERELEPRAARDVSLLERTVAILDGPKDYWRDTRTVEWMLERLTTAPWPEAEALLSHLYALGARPLAIDVLARLAATPGDPVRADGARAALVRWGVNGADAIRPPVGRVDGAVR